MNRILIYTYRTFPWIENLRDLSDKIIVLNKLSEDINLIEEELESGSYSLILGIAKADKKSLFETKGVNKFNQGKILQEGEESFTLYYPKEGYKNIMLNNSYTTSFCNWGIFRTANLLKERDLNTKHMFVHIKKEDISILQEYLEMK